MVSIIELVVTSPFNEKTFVSINLEFVSIFIFFMISDAVVASESIITNP
jgi:hypothetical protein